MPASKPLDLLLARNGSVPVRLRWSSIRDRLLSPGSVPLGILLALLGWAQSGLAYGLAWLVVGALLGILVVIARRWPAVAFLATCVTSALSLAGLDQTMLTPFVLVTPVVVTGMGFARKHGVQLTVMTAITTPVLVSGFTYLSAPNGTFVKLIWWPLVLLAVAANAILLWRKYSAQAAQLVEVQRDAEGERGQRLFLEERSRIGREMHDVVAHHMSMVAVKASTAEYRISNLSEEASEEFRAIADTARESLTEMRRILAVFRTDEHPELAPQPGIERIDHLCHSARDSGLDIVATIAPDLPDLPDAVSLTAYRIVQEVLSNIVRHAPGATATVELYIESDRLAIVVMNTAPTREPVPERPAPHLQEPSGNNATADAATVANTTLRLRTDEQDEGTAETRQPSTPTSASSETAAAGGLGLAGMRERVELLHGELFAQPLGRAGFLVKAHLPTELVEEA